MDGEFLMLVLGNAQFCLDVKGRFGYQKKNAGMVELVDATDSKSVTSNGVRVQVSLPVPNLIRKALSRAFLICGIFLGKPAPAVFSPRGSGSVKSSWAAYPTTCLRNNKKCRENNHGP